MKYTILTIAFLALFQAVVYPKTQSQPWQDKSFVILIASYNNEPWYEKNLKSVYEQDYDKSKCRIVYLDDQSTDNTYDRVKKYVSQYGQKFHTDVRRNTVRMGSMLSRYRAAHECADDEIIVYLDGDDFFPHKNVLSHLNTIYQKPVTKVSEKKFYPWMTYGSFRYWCRNCIEVPDSPYTLYTEQCCHFLQPRYIGQIPEEIFEQHRVRSYSRCYDHLSTYYAWLFKQIKLTDLVYQGWQYFITTDLAIIIPMLEMAGNHAKSVHEILYLYNKYNPLNCHKQYKGKSFGRQIRAKHPYQTLQETMKTDFQSYKKSVIGILKLPDDYKFIKKNLSKSSYTHILLMKENMHDQIPSNIDEWVNQLEITGAYAAYPLINQKILNHLKDPGPIVPFHKKFAAWQHAYNTQLTNVAKQTSMILLRTNDLITLSKNALKQKDFFNIITHAACTKESTPSSHRTAVWNRQQEAYLNRLAIFDARDQ